MAWAWLGSYAGMMVMLFAGTSALKWFCGVPVTVAFLILYRGCVARHWSRWLRVPWLVVLACGLFLWMVVFLAIGSLAFSLELSMYEISLGR